jgi:catechol 2,3-dioxygenase
METAVRIAPATRVGAVHLTVADLERSIAYYTGAIGLTLGEREGTVARLGSPGRDLLVLYEEPGARPVRGHTGLFHFALLVPERRALARWLRHALDRRVQVTGASDHLVSEALYLRDPDGHGIEIYRDRPREEWPREGEGIRMASDPLDVQDLLASLDGTAAEPFETLPPATTMGHVHLHVADIDETEAFYRDVLGFDVVARLGDQATFMSAGGYHHHVGANVWAGHGATPPPPGSAALRSATIVLPDAGERDRDDEPAADLRRRDQAPNRCVHDPEPDHEQRDSVELRGQDLDAPEAVRPPTAGRTHRDGCGEQRETQCRGVRKHVAGVREQCQRPGNRSRGELRDHQRRDEPERDGERAPVRLAVIGCMRVRHCPH